MKTPVLIKLITSDKTLKKWRSLPAKLKAIYAELDDIEGAVFTIDIEYRDVVPEVRNGYITHEWMDGLTVPEKNAHFVAFHMSNAQRKKWGIKPTLRGAHQKDFDLVGEFYLWADERTKRKGLDQLIQVFIHEFRHAFKRGAGQLDDTHELHADGDIRGSLKGLKWSDYSPLNRNLEQQISLLQRVINLFNLMPKPTLYQAALKYLGSDASPADIAPDLLGCAESVSMIIRDVLPDFPIITGTYSLYERLEADKRFERVVIPMPGTIILSPTGMGGNKKVVAGHVGIAGYGDAIMSNNSYKGVWEETHTQQSWKDYYGGAGYPVLAYRLKQ